MKNIWKLVGMFAIIVGFVIILRPRKHNPFIKRNQKEIEKIDSTQGNLFYMVDAVVDSINIKKERNINLVNNLNSQISTQSSIINNTKYTLEEKLLLVEELESKCREHKALIKSLNLRIKTYQNSNINLKNINSSLQKKIKYLSSPQYVSDTIFNTIYQIDTVYYPESEIKVLKSKKKWSKKSKKNSSPSL